MQRTVGLVNTDICVTGPIAKPSASPVLKDLVKNALENADDPTTDGDRKYYEFWEEWTNQVMLNSNNINLDVCWVRILIKINVLHLNTSK